MESGHGIPAELDQVVIFLIAAVATVALFHRLKVSPILGYLAAGVLIGPHCLALIAEIEQARILAEFGVVFLLFTVGLELSVRRLWVMRRMVFGFGGLQVLLSSLGIGLCAWAYGLSVQASIIVGGAFALSSTAMVIQLLINRGELAGRYGRASFAILLFQDLAVVPLLVFVPLLAGRDGGALSTLALAAGQGIGVIIGIFVFGRLVMRPLMRVVAGINSPELFVALVLLVVLGTGYITATVGLSMALGAFFAGLLLAESEFRHQVEADIQPFKGILLGLFFMTVGMQIDLPTIVSDFGLLLAIIFGIVAIQLVVIVALARAFGMSLPESVRVGLLLAHAGEFAFVILQAALMLDVIAYDTARILTVAAALSMFLPPLFDGLGARLATRLARGAEETETDLESLAAEAGELRDFVVIAGFGRVGQAIAKMLNVQSIPWIAIDRDARRVTEARKRDLPVYYGDTTRPEVLEAAGIADAIAAACAIDARNGAVKTVRAMHHAAPALMIFSRARDHEHSVALNDAGAGFVFPETMEAALLLGTRILDQAGKRPENLDDLLLQLRREGPFMLDPPEQEDYA